MKLKQRIARYAMPCRQHETSLACVAATDSFVANIVPLSGEVFQIFVTFGDVAQITFTNSLNTPRFRRFNCS